MSQSLLKGISLWVLPTFVFISLWNIINGETTSYFLRKTVKNPKRTGRYVCDKGVLWVLRQQWKWHRQQQQQQQQRRRRWNNYKAIETALRVGTSNYMERHNAAEEADFPSPDLKSRCGLQFDAAERKQLRWQKQRLRPKQSGCECFRT